MNKSTNIRYQKLLEQYKTLKLLIELIEIDRNSVLELVEDAKQQAPVLLDPNKQNDWLAKLRQDKVRRLAAILQSRQRTAAANIVDKNDIGIARKMLNWPTANPFRLVKPTPINKLPVIKP